MNEAANDQTIWCIESQNHKINMNIITDTHRWIPQFDFMRG